MDRQTALHHAIQIFPKVSSKAYLPAQLKSFTAILNSHGVPGWSTSWNFLLDSWQWHSKHWSYQAMPPSKKQKLDCLGRSYCILTVYLNFYYKLAMIAKHRVERVAGMYRNFCLWLRRTIPSNLLAVIDCWNYMCSRTNLVWPCPLSNVNWDLM